MSEEHPPEHSRIGRFIQTYSSFLSSFVIGVAGLIATSIYQFNQSVVARRQAESQQKIAVTQADNQWKIERAKILSENLQVLTSQGGGNVEQRYGVLLSLTRGQILDPELAVSYALELGKENPEFMRSVLANTVGKDYHRLANAFVLTCEQRYGTARPLPTCRDDKLADRSAALADLFAEDTDAELNAPQNPAGGPSAEGPSQKGPLSILRDEREVQAGLAKGRIVWLFAPFLSDAYDRRQWQEIEKFEAYSTGAGLVGALALLSMHNGEFASTTEAAVIKKSHDDHRRWLSEYLLGQRCDAECKARIANYMLTELSPAGQFAEPLRALLERPHTEESAAVAKLHARLLQCQVNTGDVAALRDQVLVPSLAARLSKKDVDPASLDDEIGLLALTPDPTDPTAQGAWDAVITALQRAEGNRYQRVFLDKRAAQKRAITAPPPSIKKTTFCTAPDTQEGDNSAQKDD